MGRLLLTRLRERSGKLPAGVSARERSLLGAVIDPFDLFRSSTLLTNDARDRAALQAAAKLASLATELDGSSAAPSEAEQQQLARALAAKAWERRRDVQEVSRRVARELLEQTATRMTTA